MMLSEPRTILITGGTSGVGLELARQLHGKGHRVIVMARPSERLSRLQDEMPGAKVYPCDLADKRSVEHGWGQVVQQHPDLSILVNNAGIQLTPCFLDEDFDFDGIEREITVNFMAPAWLACLALGLFTGDGRRAAIINVTSGLAFHPKRNAAVYCATKAALRSLTQGLRYQLEGTPISVVQAVLPLVDTPMTAGRGKGKLSATEAASGIVMGMARGATDIHVGRARWLPLLERISPAIPRAILKRG